MALALLLAGNDAFAQIITITAATSAPIPMWAVGALSLLLAALGYWALRNRRPEQLNRLGVWAVLAIISAGALALVASGEWLSRAYAIVEGNTINIAGSPTVASVQPNTDITVTNTLSSPFTIGSVTVTCIEAAPAVSLPAPQALPPACSLVAPMQSPQCVPGLTLSPSGGVCYLYVHEILV